MTAASFSFSRQIFSPPRGADRRRQVATPEFVAAERGLDYNYIASYLSRDGKYQVHVRNGGHGDWLSHGYRRTPYRKNADEDERLRRAFGK